MRKICRPMIRSESPGGAVGGESRPCVRTACLAPLTSTLWKHLEERKRNQRAMTKLGWRSARRQVARHQLDSSWYCHSSSSCLLPSFITSQSVSACIIERCPLLITPRPPLAAFLHPPFCTPQRRHFSSNATSPSTLHQTSSKWYVP